jgi:phosphatidylethanolamine/phosphatidyl-N-methylethanolamine N-methyltransferase
VNRPLDEKAVVAAYARWAPVYDLVFGLITGPAIRATMREVNAMSDGDVLEVGVGTGIALPLYKSSHRVTGIDLSADMLARARQRVATRRLANVAHLTEMDAVNLAFADASFDVAVAMFVMTVVPEPARVLDEMVRVVRPGGRIVIVNHFAAASGWRAAIERRLSPFSASLGWNPEFERASVGGRSDMRLLAERRLPPLGLYTLLVFERTAVV